MPILGALEASRNRPNEEMVQRLVQPCGAPILFRSDPHMMSPNMSDLEVVSRNLGKSKAAEDLAHVEAYEPIRGLP